jgi:hypothetical protein
VYGTRFVVVQGTRLQTVYGTFFVRTSDTIVVQGTCFVSTRGHHTLRQTVVPGHWTCTFLQQPGL